MVRIESLTAAFWFRSVEIDVEVGAVGVPKVGGEAGRLDDVEGLVVGLYTAPNGWITTPNCHRNCPQTEGNFEQPSARPKGWKPPVSSPSGWIISYILSA